MPSAYTPLGFNKQASGENENTWGEVLNDEAIELIDSAIRGRTPFTLSGSKTLTSTNGVANEARSAILHITGGTGGTVTVPNLSKPYLVINDATGAVIISAGGMTTASIAAGETAQVAVDGVAAVHKVIFSDFGGQKARNLGNPTDPQDAATKAYADSLAFDAIDLPGQDSATDGAALFSDGTSALWRDIDIADVVGGAPSDAPSFVNGIDVSGIIAGDGALDIAGAADIGGGLTVTGSTKVNVTSVASTSIDLATADVFTKSISANTSFTFDNATASVSQAFILFLTISSSAVPSWPASVDYPNGADLSSTLGNGKHLLGFVTENGGTTWTMIIVARAVA